jgi:hypothetical protein
MSSELVPQTYARSAYNVLHRTELAAHTNRLTPEQASQINSTYDTWAYVGRHGQIDKNNEYDIVGPPTQQEYEDMAKIVDGMQPGDTMYVEAPGFDGPALPPAISIEAAVAMYTDRYPTVDKAKVSSVIQNLRKEWLDDAGSQLEKLRRECKIDTFTYAESLALMKGVRVVYADIDAFDADSFRAFTGGKTLHDLLDSTDKDEKRLLRSTRPQRERTAVNILKDDALEQLSMGKTVAPDERKPKLVLLFGARHKDGLDRAFDNLGLKVNIVRMASTGNQERLLEQMGRVADAIGPVDLFELVGEGVGTLMMQASQRDDREASHDGLDVDASLSRGEYKAGASAGALVVARTTLAGRARAKKDD